MNRYERRRLITSLILALGFVALSAVGAFIIGTNPIINILHLALGLFFGFRIIRWFQKRPAREQAA